MTDTQAAIHPDAVLARHDWLVNEIGCTYILAERAYYLTGRLIATAEMVQRSRSGKKFRAAVMKRVRDERHE